MLKVHHTGMKRIFHAPSAPTLRRALVAHLLSALACVAAASWCLTAAAQSAPVLVNASGSSLPALGAYLARMRQRPAVQRAVATEKLPDTFFLRA